MKVGILTFHRAYNYGAILQAYALQEKLFENDVQSEIIDYLSTEKKKQNKLFSYNKSLGMKGNILKFLKDFYRKKKNKTFDRFMKDYMVVSDRSYATFDELVQLDQQNKYDTYIVGSDQVWNFNNTLNDPVFLLKFTSDNKKKCSYAASIGNAEFDDKMYNQYKNELGTFRILTVREDSAIKKFGFLRENHARVAVDPTLLLEKSIYESLSSPRILNKKYAFMYTIAGERNLRKFARNYCKQNGLVLIDSKKSKIFFQNASPEDFLSFIQYAECVFTNSFHGTALSIVMEQQFFTEVHTKTKVNYRSDDLINKLGLQDRDIDCNTFDSKKRIDYREVNKELKILRDRSMEILKEIIMK